MQELCGRISYVESPRTERMLCIFPGQLSCFGALALLHIDHTTTDDLTSCLMLLITHVLFLKEGSS